MKHGLGHVATLVPIQRGNGTGFEVYLTRAKAREDIAARICASICDANPSLTNDRLADYMGSVARVAVAQADELMRELDK